MHAASIVLMSVLITLALGGCASGKSYVTLIESPDGSTGKIIVRGAKGEQVVERAGEGVPLDGSEPAQPWSQDRVKQDFETARAARPIPPESFMLYFESGTTRLTEASGALLPKIYASVARRPAAEIAVIGHADTPWASRSTTKGWPWRGHVALPPCSWTRSSTCWRSTSSTTANATSW